MEFAPIETVYKGYRFRSRLEARYAVFFDALGLDWEYEKEGYDLGELGCYLPDFYLPELHIWVEIKGEQPTEEELQKCEALRDLTEHAVYIAYGPPLEHWGTLYCWDSGDSSGGTSDWYAILCVDDNHNTGFAIYGGRGKDFFATLWDNAFNVVHFDDSHVFCPTRASERAASQAKMARFEVYTR